MYSIRSVMAFACLFIGLVVHVFGQSATVRPPTIYGVTGSGTVELGQRVTLAVTMEMQPEVAYQYQWRKSSVDIPGATQATFVIEAATPADAGTYTVRVSNSAGESAASANITVRAAAAPVISIQPRSTSAQVGQTVTFSYVATGSYPRTHQWSKDGSPIAGATSATLDLVNVTTASAGSYTVVISNSLGSVTSAAALLTVNAAVPVTLSSSSPANGTYTEGSQVDFYVTVQNGSSPLTYQWYKDGSPLAGPAGTANPLRFTAITVAQAGAYSVVVSNVLGSVTSRTATIAVTPATPVSITTQPRAVAVFEGESASFSVSASGTSPRYQWHKDGVAIAGATGSGHYISQVRPADVGSYTVLVSNIKGAVTSSAAALTIKPAELPVITTQPVDVQTTEGQSIGFSVSATGSPTLRYQWHINGVAVSGATDRYFSRTAQLSDNGTCYVIVTNSAGSVRSREAKVTVDAMPPPTTSAISVSGGVIGSESSLSTNYYGSGVTLQWYKDGQPIAGATSSSLGLRTTAPDDAGDYFVVVSNSGGTTTSLTKRLHLRQSSTPPTGSWIGAERSGDIVYFAFSNPARVERYHLPSETWLGTLQLPRSPQVLAVDSGGLYIGSGSSIYRYNLDGSGETAMGSALSTPIRRLVVHRGYLIASHGGSASLASIRLSDGVVVSRRDYSLPYPFEALVSVPAAEAVFARSQYYGLMRLPVSAEGVLPASASFPQYISSGYPASSLYLAPDNATVIDGAGLKFRLSDLTYTTGGVTFDDLVFRSDGGHVALRGGSLYYHDAAGLEVGRVSGGLATARKIATSGDTVYSFAPPAPGGGISVSKASITPALSPRIAAPLDGATVSFNPTATLVDRGGVLILYSKELQQVFRWSTAERRFLAPIPLQGWPNAIAYADDSQRLYLAYDEGRVLQVALDGANTREQPFSTAPRGVANIVATPYSLLSMAPSEMTWSISYSTGAVLWRSTSSLGTQVVWSSALNRAYFFTPSSSYSYVMDMRADGTLANGTSRYMSDNSVRDPYRLSPDGSTLLTGSGRFYDAVSFVASNALPNSIADAVWLGRTPYTARSVGAGVLLQRWGGNNYAEDANRTIPGRFVRMWELPSQRLAVITQQSGTTVVSVVDAGFNVLSTDFVGTPTRLVNLAARALVGQGDQILIPGFVIGGTQPKRLLIRAAGPALAGFGVEGTLSDPAMELLNASSTVVATNDNWGSSANSAAIASTAATVGAFAFAAGSRDAAALVTLQPGAYTVKTTGVGDATGVALVEVYDVPEQGNNSRLINIAARAQVGTGANILIPGIVIQGNSPKTVLVRAVGPGLGVFGVTGTLANPRLRIFRGDTMLHENDDWGQSANASLVSSAASSVGAFAIAPGSRDAALLVTLPPGAYTAQVSGVDGGSGVAIVEVYEVNN